MFGGDVGDKWSMEAFKEIKLRTYQTMNSPSFPKEMKSSPNSDIYITRSLHHYLQYNQDGRNQTAQCHVNNKEKTSGIYPPWNIIQPLKKERPCYLQHKQEQYANNPDTKLQYSTSMWYQINK